MTEEGTKAAVWIAAGVAGAGVSLLVFDGFFAGVLVVLTLVATLLAAFFAWLEGQ